MSDPRTVNPEAAAEANRRYWDTDASVNHIAEDLGLSKSSLYGLVEQLETGLACPDCGSELVFPNRTARDRGMVSCPACPFEAQADEVMEAVDGEGAVTERASSSLTTGANGRVLAGTALLGVAAGVLLGSMFRRR
jgi:predicted RNA-binding Zn-ribbon protein involved in translation (DUF1610 family)